MNHTGKSKMVGITGWVFAMHADSEQPVLLKIEGMPWLPLFPTPDELFALWKQVKMASDTPFRVKQIEDPRQFLMSIGESGISACIDLRQDADGKLRFSILDMNSLLPKTAVM